MKNEIGTRNTTSVIATILEEQFPQLAPVSASVLGEGCDSVAFDVNATFVFRFPKSADSEEQLSIEARILPLLAKRLPVPVPEFRFHGRPSAQFPRRFIGYPKLPGIRAIELGPPPGDPELAKAIGRFLSALHAFAVDQALAAGVPDSDTMAAIGELRQEALDDFEVVARVAPDAPLKQWRDFLAAGDGGGEPGTRVLVHNDFAAEHVLVDADAGFITGIIDWSDIAVSDPAADFAGLFHWGGAPFVEAVMSHYAGILDARARQRAQFMAVCRGVGDVKFGLAMNRGEYVAAGLRALAMCAREDR